MASSHNTHSETARMEQVITEFFAKSLHIILESRSPNVSSRNFIGDQATSSPSSSSSSSSSVRPRDKWFNLALRECPAALENIDLWRQNNLEPMVVDVVLVKRPIDWDRVNSPSRNLARNLSLKERHPNFWNYDQEEISSNAKGERIIERWIVQYESRRCKDTNSGNRRSNNIALHTLYKKSILLLRTLYSTVRLLPAYKIFRDLHSSSQIQPFTLTHRLSSFVEPFTGREEAEMQQFGFNPVDTSSGRLCLSVLYRSSLSDMSSESSTPMSPQVIQDYVGSPLADPLKRFPSLPMSGASPHGSPSSLAFSRHHSWSYDRYKASPPSLSFSPSSIHSESHASVSNPASRRLPPSSLPPHPSESVIQKKNTRGDEYYPSPTISTSMSPSLSPPIYIPGRHVVNNVLRSESAPANVPTTKLPNFPASSNKSNFPPSPPLKVSGFGPSITNRYLGSFQTASTVEKSFSLGRDETRKYSGWKVSCSYSPQISISRSSSRSFPDDFDDSEFPCPFDIDDDDDMTDPGSRPDSFDQKGGHMCDLLEPGGPFPIRKSQDAAVGAFVRMLRKAPPLRQDLSNSFNTSPASRPESWSNKTVEDANQNSEEVSTKGNSVPSTSIASSGLRLAKTTADALEELQSYREMKNLLLKQGSVSQL